jgi:hypothetical protein
MAFEDLRDLGFQVEFHSHAKAILETDFPSALIELENSLRALRLPIEEIIGSGGGEAKGTQRLRRSLAGAGWNKERFLIQKTINGVLRESQSHEIDHVRRVNGNAITLEIEWNNKDPFFDRDLENFKRLHAEGATSAGVIITRGIAMQNRMRDLVSRFSIEKNLKSAADLAELGLAPTIRQRRDYERRAKRPGITFGEAWAASFVQDKYGAATTHWGKLEDRVRRGVGNPCPLLLVGLPAEIVTFNEPAEVITQLLEEGIETTPEEGS